LTFKPTLWSSRLVGRLNLNIGVPVRATIRKSGRMPALALIPQTVNWKVRSVRFVPAVGSRFQSASSCTEARNVFVSGKGRPVLVLTMTFCLLRALYKLKPTFSRGVFEWT
jgi:hypothetical protein